MREMTSLERVQAVMKGEVPDYKNPAAMAKCHLECREKYGGKR